MIDAYLIPIEDAAIIFILLAILLLIPLCVVHYRRFGYVRPTRAIVFYSFLFYILCAMCLVTLPLPEITPNFCEGRVPGSHVRLIPFQFVADILTVDAAFIRSLNLLSILASPVFLQAAFNFLMLLPLGFYLQYYFRARFTTALVVAIATTLLFEVTQLTGIYGLYPCSYRVFDVDDLILNASGAMLGYAIAPLFPWLPNLQRRPRPQPVTVSIPRRMVAFAIDWFLANTLSRLIYLPFAGSASHSVWVDFVVYAGWFIAIPLLWHGQTVGKKLVQVRIRDRGGASVSLPQLCWRYGLLIFLPVAIEVSLNAFETYQLNTLGYVTGILPLFLLGLLGLQFCLILGLMLFRSDHRGLHEILSKTCNVLS